MKHVSKSKEKHDKSRNGKLFFIKPAPKTFEAIRMNTRKTRLISIGNIYSAPINHITFSNELVTKSACEVTKTKCYAVFMTSLNYLCEFGVERWYVCDACFGFSFR